MGVVAQLNDVAGNDTVYGLNDDRISLLLSSEETHGALVDKVINFPNPFRTVSGNNKEGSVGTTVRYVLTRPVEEVVLRVFEAAGEQLLVAQLPGIAPGEHLVSWSGRDIYGDALASGVYFGVIEIQSGSDRDIQRMIMAINNR